MDTMSKLKFKDKQIMMEGIVIEKNDCAVTVDLKDGIGHFKVPMRMLISQNQVELGQTVAFMMSYPEVLNDGDNEHYISNLQKLQK